MSPKQHFARNTTRELRGTSSPIHRRLADDTSCLRPSNALKSLTTEDAYREHRRKIEAASAARKKELLDALQILVKQRLLPNDRPSIRGAADAVERAIHIIHTREEELKAQANAREEDLMAQIRELEIWKNLAIEFLNSGGANPQDETYWNSALIGSSSNAFQSSFDL
ncbi:hypothetical protein SISSUDRAFT_1121799 [Sistotremastrum suecicum HHB10207 ss-3]|uniref:Uncharacterized protein n=1 Tax=Sistotremastrum suecicum HHB10207 ss-3 TaxID=1314776 RepID=A0A166AA44_9AGAM|nr:hypothetical protein SISSUDRAFT_1121799 [Sistotremastrum suecicum HHB10207 ss-3]